MGSSLGRGNPLRFAPAIVWTGSLLGSYPRPFGTGAVGWVMSGWLSLPPEDGPACAEVAGVTDGWRLLTAWGYPGYAF